MKEGKHRVSRCFLQVLRVTPNLQDNHWDACHLLQLIFSWNTVFLPFLCPSQEFSWWRSFLKSQGSLLNSVFTDYKSFQLTHTNMFLYRITSCWHFNIILPGYFFFRLWSCIMLGLGKVSLSGYRRRCGHTSGLRQIAEMNWCQVWGRRIRKQKKPKVQGKRRMSEWDLNLKFSRAWKTSQKLLCHVGESEEVARKETWTGVSQCSVFPPTQTQMTCRRETGCSISSLRPTSASESVMHKAEQCPLYLSNGRCSCR